jgi:hypothetical protein
MSETVPSYDEDDFEAPGASDLEQLAKLAHEQEEAEREIEDLQRALSMANDALRDISERRLPELLKKVGMETFTTTDGLRLTTKEKLRCGMPEARRDEGCNWLEANGQAPVVKRAFEILFGRDEEAWAKKFEADLRKRKRALQFKRFRWVEPSTLNKVLRDMLKAGVDVPMEIFSASVINVTKVERVKNNS